MDGNQAKAFKGDILVVDDKPDNLRLLSAMLGERGYKVRSVINGQMALNAAQASPPDLILLDINMPQMNGYQVCQKLKGLETTCDVPIIFVSALDDVLDKVEAFALGAVDYITKPFEVEEVLARVENQLTICRLQKQLQEQNARLQQEILERQKAETALQEANQELQRFVTIDGLTQVSNRRCFDQCLQQEWRRLCREELPLSLILCDVDYFKAYNDTYGHQAGDECLQQIAQAIRRVLKRAADVVARYGGEEFAVILPNTHAQGAVYIAECIHQEITNISIPHGASQVSEFVTVSMGVASMIPTQEATSKDLLIAADQALYQAKNQGRNRMILSPALEAAGEQY